MKKDGNKADHVLYNTIVNGCLYNQSWTLACQYAIESFEMNIKMADDLYHTLLRKITAHYCNLKQQQKVEYCSRIVKELKDRGLDIPEELYSKVAKLIYQTNGKSLDQEYKSNNKEYKDNNKNNYDNEGDYYYQKKNNRYNNNYNNNNYTNSYSKNNNYNSNYNNSNSGNNDISNSYYAFNKNSYNNNNNINNNSNNNNSGFERNNNYYSNQKDETKDNLKFNRRMK